MVHANYPNAYAVMEVKDTAVRTKEEFKQTEVGLIPNDWKVRKISQIATISTGSKNTQDKIDNGTYPFFVRSQTIERINSFSFDGEAVLTAGDGVGTGKIFHYIKGKFDFHQRVYKISHFDLEVDGYYFYLYFSNHFYSRIMQMTAKSSVDSVRMEMIADMYIPLPPTEAEQTAIATALSDTDALISRLETLIEKKRAIKQGAMQQLLKPKEGWIVKKLGEVADVTMGQSPLSRFYNKEGRGLPLIQGNADIENRKTIIRTFSSLTTKRGKKGDIIMSVRAPVGEVSKASFDCCLGRGVCSISYKNDYLYHFLIFFEKSWSKYSTGSTFDSVNSQQVKELSIPIPQLESEQIRIAQILSDMDAEIAGLEQKLVKYKLVKQGMMQELLAGKTRLV